MNIPAETPDEYMNKLPDDRKQVISKLRQTLKANLPEGFSETINYGMIGYVVPHSLYPKGYHCDTKLPLPFINIASQKNFVALYHMGLYADTELHEWFTKEYPKHCKSKLDMGKSCIRFKKLEQIPYDLIASLSQRVSVDKWINIYENKLSR
jgi:uncharacterized protein YdhG (YjbR/CyaY superfamily)